MADLKDEVSANDVTSGATLDMKLEVIVIPVLEVDRAKLFGRAVTCSRAWKSALGMDRSKCGDAPGS